LRIEDHDRQRSKKAHEKTILEELAYLGFYGDVGISLENMSEQSQFRQSDHEDKFVFGAKKLEDKNLTYVCTCTRKDIVRSMGEKKHPELLYSGTCREKGLGLNYDSGIRVKVDDKAECFEDLFLGKQTQSPSQQCGDFLIKDKKKNWTYQFANVVDDINDGVNLIIRGEDIMSSTGRQIKLMKYLGAPINPVFCHHPLIMENDQKEKLSKRIHSESVSDFMSQGEKSESILGRAAYAVGLIDQYRPLVQSELPKLFSK